MFHHYLTTALRNIKKNKLSFFINLIGLSLGLASAFIISSYVLKETSYDKFHPKKDQLYRVLCDNQHVNWTSPGVPYIIKENIDNSIPAVDKSCLLDNMYMARIKQGEEFINFRRMYASTPEFFNLFDCNVIYGSIDNALKNMNSLVITQSAAKKYFKYENPVGKTIEIKLNATSYPLTIDAVIEDFPDNSSFKFNGLCNYQLAINHYESMPWASEFRTSWNLNFNRMFVLLKDSQESFQLAWNSFEEQNNFKEKQLHFHLQKLRDIHLNSDGLVNDGKRGDKTYIYLFSSIAFIILLVAAFNYIILSISVSKTRFKEIGVKKIVGSQNSTIRKQFFIESIVLSLLAFPIAYLLASWSVNFLNQLFGVSLSINIFKSFNQLLTFVVLLFLNGLLAGSYIAFYLSRLNPLDIIKSRLGNQNRKVRFQYVILLFQIMVFSGLMGASFSIYKQINYIKNADLGINLNNKFSVSIDNMEITRSSYQTICNILEDIPEVKNYTLGSFMPPENSRGVSTAPDPNDDTKQIKYEGELVSHRFFDFFGIQCLEGRLFDPDFKDDSNKIVVNESFIKAFGFENPIGKMINDREIIGVIKNYYNHSLHEDISPTLYSLVEPKYVYEIGIEYNEGLGSQCAQKVTHELSKLNSEANFDAYFIENEIEDLYSDETKLNKIIIYFSIFAAVIALIGIFGQSLFAVKQQYKEIGIRKVNGATSKNILLLFFKRYLLLCVIANIISWPIVFYIVDAWQNQFVFKSQINIWIILLTLILSILVVLGTVLSNAWKASLTNPVDVLKYE